MSRKVKLPTCSKCQTDKYMAWDRKAEKVGTVAGGASGAGAAYAGMAARTLSSMRWPGKLAQAGLKLLAHGRA